MRSTNNAQKNDEIPSSWLSFSSSVLNNSYIHSLWRNTSWLNGLPPYPNVPHLRGNPLTGRLPYLQKDGGLMLNFVEAGKLAEKSAKGMCSFWVENKLVLLITKPEYVYDMKMHFAKYLQPGVENWDVFPGPAVISDPKKGPQLRKLYQHTVADTQKLNDLKVKIAEISAERITKLKEQKTPAIDDARNYFRGFALELTARLFMGIDEFNRVNCAGLLEYLKTFLAGIGPDTPLNLLGLKAAPVNRFFSRAQLMKQINHLKNLNVSPASFLSGVTELDTFNEFKQTTHEQLKSLLYESHKDTITGSDNLLHSIWDMAREKRGDKELTLENLFPDAFFFIAGGLILTTGDSFPIILQLICKHPEVKEKLLLELQQRNQTAESKSDDTPSPYLDMIIKEAFRINPPVPIIPARTAKESFVFHGVQIKKGESVLVSPQISHHLAASWKDPEKFIPERFSPENESSIPKGAYIPFGIGARDCIGRNYGLAVLKTLLSKLFLEFDVTLENNNSKQALEGPTMATNQMSIRLTPHTIENTNRGMQLR